MSHRSITQVGTTEDIFLQIVRGYITGHSVIHKFGRISDVTTTPAVIAVGGIYQTPLVSNVTTLRIKAGGDANDTLLGSGARKVILEGLDVTGVLISDELELAGASASSVSSKSFLRLFRAYVSESGSAATTPLVATQADTITIENSAGTADWAVIDGSVIGSGQTEIGAYSIPLGFTGYITDIHFDIKSVQACDLWMIKRNSMLTTAVPFDANRIQFSIHGSTGAADKHPKVPIGPFLELTDISFLARSTASTSDVNVEFTIILIRNE